MRYYKIIEEGYIIAIGIGQDGVEINEEEYNELLAFITKRPIPTEGKDFRLTEQCLWEEFDVPSKLYTETEDIVME